MMQTTLSHKEPDATERTGGAKLNRACEGCRTRKTRCIMPSGENQRTAPCMRCARLDIHCRFLAPAIKRRRVRSEARIGRLEQTIQELQATLSGARAKNRHVSAAAVRDDSDSQLADLDQVSESFPSVGTSGAADKDFVDRELVSEELAQKLYCEFRDRMMAVYPLVYLSSDLSLSQVRTERPILFRVALTIGASSHDPNLFESLFEDTSRYLVAQVVSGAKELDLLLGLLALSIWYPMPKNYQDMNFTQLATMAATMAHDLQHSNRKDYRLSGTIGFNKGKPNREACRGYLVCFLLCSSMSVTMRRPTTLPDGPWVDDCIRAIDSDQHMHLHDHQLIEWVKLQRIAEACLCTQTSLRRARLVLQYGIEKANTWMEHLPPGLITEAMAMHYHMVIMRLHEATLYDDYSIHDFQPPYKLRPLPLTRDILGNISADDMSSAVQCISSSQQIVQLFLRLPSEILRSLPVILYARVAYAAVVMLRITNALQTLPKPSSFPCNSELVPKILLSELINRLRCMIGVEGLQVPAAFRVLFFRIARWYERQLRQHILLNNHGYCCMGDADNEQATVARGFDLANSQLFTTNSFSTFHYAQDEWPTASNGSVPDVFDNIEVQDAWLDTQNASLALHNVSSHGILMDNIVVDYQHN